ncbi:hypothetical protein [Jeotgalibacillus aurantiacus]|uniref:hypothetical protein n=1 Tax=Jeotgalibacillus aurantiacus TaxID=2763266 RepID=UPI001D0A76AD|nr:hypothetical protein [Jeotgalibacillus aurantiacus]
MVEFITIIPVILFACLLYFLVKRFKKPRVGVSRIPVKYMLGSYALILIITMIFYYASEGTESSAQTYNSLHVDEMQNSTLQEQAMNRNFEKIDEKYFKGQERIELQTETLELKDSTGIYTSHNHTIIITEESGLDAEILIDTYATPFLVNGVDVSEDFWKSEFTYSQGTMILKIPEQSHIDLEYAQFTPSIVNEQFMDSDPHILSNMNFREGLTIYHLQIPESLELKYDENDPIYQFEQ